MYKIIGADGNEYGPVTLEQLRQWVSEGRVNAETQTQLAGETGWTALGVRPEFAILTPRRPGGAPGLPTPDEIRARDYHLDLGECVRRGWQILTANAGLLIAGTVVVLLLNALASAPSNVGSALLQHGQGKIPLLVIGGGLMLVGWGLSIVLTGPLLGGLYWPFIKLTRGERIEFGDFFAGFRRGFLNLMLGNIVAGILAALCVVPGVAVLAAGVALHAGGASSALGIPLIVVGAILTAVGLGFAIYFTVCWLFTLPLIVDRQLGFWEAMKLGRAAVRKHWWGVLGVMIVVGLIAVSGVVACCVGLVFTLPLGFAIQMVVYESIFGARSPAHT